jgi:hypothetical protein
MPSALIERQNVNATRRLVVAATVVAFAGIGAAAEEQVLAFAAAEPIALAKTGLKSWRSLPVPLLAALPLHRDARRISHLDPCWVRPGPVGDITKLQAAEEDILHKISAPPPRPATAPAYKLAPLTPPPLAPPAR